MVLVKVGLGNSQNSPPPFATRARAACTPINKHFISSVQPTQTRANARLHPYYAAHTRADEPGINDAQSAAHRYAHFTTAIRQDSAVSPA